MPISPKCHCYNFIPYTIFMWHIHFYGSSILNGSNVSKGHILSNPIQKSQHQDYE